MVEPKVAPWSRPFRDARMNVQQKKSFLGAAAACAALGLAGCPKKPAAPPPEPTATVAPVATPKKKPCVAMSEECVASADTQAKIPSTDFVFIPPPGWTFAQESGQTLAKLKDQPLAMAATGLDLPKAPTDQVKARDATFTSLTQAVGVPLAQQAGHAYSPRWTKSDDATKCGNTTCKIWQTDAKLGDKPGVLLTFTTQDSGGKEILGIAFCPNDAASVALVNKSLETFGPGSYQ